MSYIPIPGEDESQWNKHPHREWGCASPGMHILTRNGNVTQREWGCALPGMHMLTTWRSGYCYLNKGECDLNQSKYDPFVERGGQEQ